MATKKRNIQATKARRTATHTHSPDAIRIVPIAAPADLFPHVAGVPATSPPALTYRGGPLLASVQVFSLFIGGAWSGIQQKTLAAQLDAFFTFVLSSELIDQLSEYSVPKIKIQHGKYLGSRVLSSIALSSSVTDAWIRKTLKQAIAGGGGIPKPAANVLYFVHVPPGITLVQGGGHSCQSFCGYHDHIGGTIFYAAMPFPNCNGCLGSLAVLDALTSTSSHELCEAITDPVPGAGWYDDVHGEIGDICAWQTRRLGSYTVQLEWSNARQACR